MMTSLISPDLIRGLQVSTGMAAPFALPGGTHGDHARLQADGLPHLFGVTLRAGSFSASLNISV
ncbi:MAG: hypothetical protein IMW90_19270 [Thermogemmatispora sp.]|jgi:hypothetical protein|uniref:hypothetical protein n=1 Tax=Thermogemmatispora sp. TaxID=1968838 RepID=UPI001A0D37EC|nr:hypothetical protein [Thermogemmatispora sp.]MBE3567864.1 hypothetical protein [Thermogemmatispora sp.]